ncbi:expressed unknown protein [Seminavis robusta]|uniref:Uncharacterized protein n=1 Tax=Seminavis robusta TaxID=568900 RepID=A0A9N8DHX7_9STRA|nr:expressed unknown protein [Seminavis robusta]|eukprot:Sro73_g040570.1 n/a (194) ;mRNA; r:131011-131592
MCRCLMNRKSMQAPSLSTRTKVFACPCLGRSKAAPIKKANRIKKAVRFSTHLNKVNVCHIPLDVRKRTWHTREDYQDIKMEAKKFILLESGRSASNGVPPSPLTQLLEQENNDFTPRGLETVMSPQVRSVRKEWVGNTVRGVLLLQQIHKMMGVQNPEQLREISTSASQSSAFCAQMLGASDAEECSSWGTQR